MASPLQLGFQDASSFLMNEFHQFHDYCMSFIVLVTIIIIYGLIIIFFNSPTHWKLTEKQQIELWWTISPSFILVALAIPSINLLYFMDESNNPDITIKTIGHQWYWSYEIWDENRIEIDSYMTHLEDISQNGLPRLLEVDNRLTIPYNTNIRIITSSTDVIHAWSLPTLGLKMDAVPGRLNQMFININRAGIFYGQCSEICGANHSFMPIVIEAVNNNAYFSWCNNNLPE
uniref:Cytochrome c oxidase subunit 2 n=1 Tax=Gorgonocephalus chilensis TaxID=1258644 RepID=A0A3G2WI55_9ECHI|nr:cytochrome c oxidase subunit II [Gorgonocephalus chilensis]AYO99630.1 cytochrome c oxidase subunit 2 [Gorgonocephalus chilensis]